MSSILKFIKDVGQIQFTQCRRLFTYEDSRFAHFHKILGLFTLFHFAFRLNHYYTYGDMGFHDQNLKWFNLLSYICHSLLHVSSFQFHISNKRNYRYNIIWPEMRIHTMLFAYRSLYVLFLHWIFINTSWFDIMKDINIERRNLFLALRGIIIVITMISADFITYFYRKKNGDLESSEKKETSMTMRKNPYPEYFSKRYITFHNYFYSVSQVLATLNVMTSSCMDKVFLILLPIQTAPFCMTLVKKGIINASSWHFYYSIALLINYMTPSTKIYGIEEFGFVLPRILYLILALYFSIGRFKFGMNKYILWCSIICFLYTIPI